MQDTGNRECLVVNKFIYHENWQTFLLIYLSFSDSLFLFCCCCYYLAHFKATLHPHMQTDT